MLLQQTSLSFHRPIYQLNQLMLEILSMQMDLIDLILILQFQHQAYAQHPTTEDLKLAITATNRFSFVDLYIITKNIFMKSIIIIESNINKMNLQKLVSSEASYQKFIQKTLQSIKGEQDQQSILRNLVLFCKQVFASNTNQRKKYLCLLLIRDIFQNANSEHFQKLVDEYLALKLYGMIQNYLETKNKGSQNAFEDRQGYDKTFNFAVETVVFWSKRLSFMPKSTFSQIYDELKKLGIEFPQEFTFYKKQMLIKLWQRQNHEDKQLHESNPILEELNKKFKICKQQLQTTINESVLNDEEVLVKPIIQKLRQFLIYFFGNYKNLQSEESQDRDIIIVYFHIINNLYKRICSRIYVSIQEIIELIKQVFQTTYPPQYDSVDRMDIIQLAGVFKYNALTIFQRIHQRIEKEDALLGQFKTSLNLQHSQPLKITNLQRSRSNRSQVNSTTYLHNKKIVKNH